MNKLDLIEQLHTTFDVAKAEAAKVVSVFF